MNLRIIFQAFFLLLFTSSAFSQTDNLNSWYQYTVSAKLSEKWSATALSQYRSYDVVKDGRLFLVSGYLERNFKNGISPAAGYMFLILEPYTDVMEKKIRYENRPYQQLSIRNKVGNVSVMHRYRAEQRFLTNPDDFILRLRYLISLKFPMYKKEGTEVLYGIFKNEIRMNVVKDEQFDSNRITAGLGINLGKNSSLELGFINQVGADDTANYTVVSFKNNFDFSKNND